MNAGEGVEKRKAAYTVGRNVNWYSHYGEQYGEKLKTELPCDPAIPLLGIYPKVEIIHVPQCSSQHVNSNQDMEAT